MDALRLSPLALDSMVAWCRKALPWEGCGLFGAQANDEERVTHLWPCENVAQSAHQFRIAQGKLVTVVRQAQRANVVILGGWHSHTTGSSTPSQADLQLGPYHGWVHLIIGLTADAHEAKAWQGRAEVPMIIDG